MTRADVRKTYKLYIGGAFPRSESGRSYVVNDAKGRLDKSVADEAATLGTLYREVSAYPEPQRTILREDLVAYTDNVLTVAWPALIARS